MTDRKRQLTRRVASALVLAAFAALVVSAGILPFAILVTVLAALVLLEFRSVAGVPGATATWAMVAMVAICGIAHSAGSPLQAAFAMAASLFAVPALVLADGRRQDAGAWWSMAALFYVALPAFALLMLRARGVEPVFWLFAVVWTTDIGAWLAGSTFGGPKLWPRVSPNKHWSGVAGGVVLGGWAGMTVHEIAGSTTEWPLALGAAVAVSLAAQAGDLLESGWKRHFNVKDSGSIIPGHGGVMDRVDGLIVASVVFALGVVMTGTTP
ncbi:MAG: phosphatidate cytidylyltransferase [Pseudomonadota bacterium]|nr:phosphatidate cytidylyltransferase [Pseudomonadota bacterium]